MVARLFEALLAARPTRAAVVPIVFATAGVCVVAAGDAVIDVAALPLVIFGGLGGWLLRSGRGSSSLVSNDDGWVRLDRELARSRRHERQFALARFVTGSSAVSRSIEREVRSLDVVWHDGGTVYALLPEASRTQVEALLSRLRTAGGLDLSGLAVSTAVFPDDGVTVGGLLLHLASPQPESQDVPTQRTVPVPPAQSPEAALG